MKIESTIDLSDLDTFDEEGENFVGIFLDARAREISGITKAMANKSLDEVTRKAIIKIHEDNIEALTRFLDNLKVEL